MFIELKLNNTIRIRYRIIVLTLTNIYNNNKITRLVKKKSTKYISFKSHQTHSQNNYELALESHGQKILLVFKICSAELEIIQTF